MSASIPVAFAQNVLADQYDEQVKKLQSEADSYQQQAATLGALASTLQAQLDVLTKQKNEIQALAAKTSAITLTSKNTARQCRTI